jgi:hypothetical protein
MRHIDRPGPSGVFAIEREQVHARHGVMRGSRSVAAFWAVAALSACLSPSAPRHAPPHAAPVDTSYDWHGLILLRFGTLLKDSPIALHEVLLFQDAAHGGGGGGGGDRASEDCYTIGGVPPPFVGRRPDEYLLCFSHDHLIRIDASVRLPAESAGPIFAAACAQWRATEAPVAQAPGSCDGRDGTTRFSARLAGDPESAAAASAPAAVALSISLFDADEP